MSITPDDITRALEAGQTLASIARTHGVSRQRVSQLAQRYGISPTDPTYRAVRERARDAAYDAATYVACRVCAALMRRAQVRNPDPYGPVCQRTLACRSERMRRYYARRAQATREAHNAHA